MPRPKARRASKRKRRQSRLLPALVLVTLAGAACTAAYLILHRGPSRTDFDDEFGMPAPDLAQIGAGGVAEIRLKDEDDPNRLAAIISYDSQTPIGQGRYDTVNPRAWVYLDDGSYLHVRADHGRFYAPDEQRPQTGVMTGNVVIRLFDPAPTRPADDAQAPVTIRATAASFDTEYGSIESEDPIEATTPEATFRLNGMRLVINQVEERIELLEVRGGGMITYTPLAQAEPEEQASDTVLHHPGAPPRAGRTIAASYRQPDPAAEPESDDTDPSTPEPATAAPRAANQPGPRRQAEPPVHYFAQFQEGVRITQGGVSASGDLLEVHARLIDNKIADHPITPQAAPPVSSRPGVATTVRSALLTLTSASLEPASPRYAKWPPFRRPAHTGTPQPADIPMPAIRTIPSPGVATNVPVTLEWTGPLTLRPLAAEPPELRREHLVARLTGGESGGVILTDAESGATGSCARLEYGFTTRGVVLAGVGETGVRLAVGARSTNPASPSDSTDASPTGTLRAGRAEYSVASGVGRVPGPGTLEGQGFQRIAWSRQMDFVLRVQDGRVLADPEEVIFQGDVHGEDEAASFDAGYARAVFIAPRNRGRGRDEDARATISSIFLEESVTLRGREDERVAASQLHVEFDTPEGTPSDRPIPTFFEAEGGVVATRPGERIAADHVEATLTPGSDARPEVQTIAAAGGVDLRSRREGLEITGDALDADIPAMRLRVQGTPESLARVARGRTAIAGVDVHLAGRPRAAQVIGMGEFSHKADGTPGESTATSPGFGTEARDGTDVEFEASWTSSMTFDDLSGALRCEGDVVATMREGDARLDRLSAAVIEAAIDPAAGHASLSLPQPGADANAPLIADPNTPVPDPTSPSPDSHGDLPVQPEPPTTPDPDAGLIDAALTDPASENRRLLTLEATGSIVHDPGGRPAQIESRRYGPPAPDGSPVLAQLLYLEGARILIDNAAGTLDVPGAGKLVVADRRTPDAERPADQAPLAGGAARGDGLFNWSGSLHVERDTGHMTMTDAVEMTHRRLGDGVITELRAPVLSARVSGGGPPDDRDDPASPDRHAGRLQSVHAEGGVWVKSGEQEITAHTIDYDADTGILTAHTPGGTVRIMNGANIWNAAAIRWDMHADRIEIIDPPGSVSPR